MAGDYAFTYTANGELLTKSQNGQTVTYQYDVNGALLGVDLADGTAIDYITDAAGRRIGKKVNGTLVKGFLYAGISPVAELDGTGTVVATFVYGRKPHVPDYMLKDGKKYRFVTDHLGSVRLVIDSATGEVAQRVDYSAFGRTLFDSNPGFQPFGFAGGLYDPQAGLVRFGARDYDPVVGRWTAKDPIGFGGGDGNLYAYVGNNPINRIDPTGLDFWDAAGGFVKGLVVGLVVGAAVGAAVAVAPAAAPFLLIAGAIGLATVAVEGYNLFSDPCAATSEKHEFLGELAGGLVGGGLGYRGGGRLGRWWKGPTPRGPEYAVQFGRVPNQVQHAFRHTDALGLEREAVQQAIGNDLASMGQLSAGLTKGKVKLDGFELDYSAFLLDSGVVNVGRITPRVIE